jgi:hypothetical protein
VYILFLMFGLVLAPLGTRYQELCRKMGNATLS